MVRMGTEGGWETRAQEEAAAASQTTALMKTRAETLKSLNNETPAAFLTHTLYLILRRILNSFDSTSSVSLRTNTSMYINVNSWKCYSRVLFCFNSSVLTGRRVSEVKGGRVLYLKALMVVRPSAVSEK